MYWQEKLLASANENRSQTLTFANSGFNSAEIDQILASARSMQYRAVRKSFSQAVAPIVWLVKELSHRAAIRRDYKNLMLSDRRLLADIGLDRTQLKNAVYGRKPKSIFVAAAKAVFAGKKAVEEKSENTANVELTVVPTQDVVAANDAHQKAA